MKEELIQLIDSLIDATYDSGYAAGRMYGMPEGVDREEWAVELQKVVAIRGKAYVDLITLVCDKTLDGMGYV